VTSDCDETVSELRERLAALEAKLAKLQVHAPPAPGRTRRLATLGEDPSGAGVIWVKNAQDQIVAGMTGAKNNAGTMLVTNAAGETGSEMGAYPDGRGAFMVRAPGTDVPAVVMTRSPDFPGGLLQLTNTAQTVVSLTVGQLGQGHLELNNQSGVPMVQGGMTLDGRGMVATNPSRCAPSGMGLTISDCIIGAQQK
jgi:hypothetical protein